MKKALLSILTLSAIVLVACGPSKAYTASEAAANDAIAKIEAAASVEEINTVMADYSAQIETATAENGAMSEAEATKFAEVLTNLTTVSSTKLDSLNQVAMAAAAAAAEAAAAEIAAAEEAAKTAKKK